MKNYSYNNKIVKSDYVDIKGTVSLNHFNVEEKPNCSTGEDLDVDYEKKLQEINQKLEEANSKYEEILTKANIEREKILEQCKQEVSEIEKNAYQEGYEQGSKNGYEDGYKEAYEDNIEKAKEEASEILESANKMMLEANKNIASYIKDNKKNIIAIGISVAEKILRQKFEDKKSMDALILDVIREYELKENFVIRVNSIYKESLEKQISNLKESNILNKDVFIVCDDSIEKGNASIESVNGKLIVGIDDVLNKVKEELL